LNEKLTVVGGRWSLKSIDAVLGRIGSISSDFVEIRSFSQHMAFNIIGATLFGDAFFDWSDAAAYEELLMMVAKDGCFWASCAVPPFWKPGDRRYRTCCAKLKILTQGIIRKSKDQNITVSHFDQKSCQRSEGMVEDPRGGVLNGMMSGHGAAEAPLGSEEETCGNIMGLMLHGISTSANLISNILTWIVLSPKLQDQVHNSSFILFPVANYFAALLSF
jgi:cytochrome P450